MFGMAHNKHISRAETEKQMTLFHAGPKGLTELKTARELIDSGELTIDAYAEAWEAKWGDRILDPWSLMGHPAMDEICFTTDKDEAAQIASMIDGCVYVVEVDNSKVVINNEGYPSIKESVGCTAV